MSNNENMKVAVRVRPLKNCGTIKSHDSNRHSIITVTDNNSLIFDPHETEEEFFFHGKKQTCRDITIKENKNLSLNCDNVFNEKAKNKDVFERCMKPLVHRLMNGFNCSILNYGASGTGKTHTMFGKEEERGIVYLTMEYIFFQLNKRLSKDCNYQVRVSYLEVYNEQIKDLLTKSQPLTLTEIGNGEDDITGLSFKKISALNDVQKLLTLGNRNRTKNLVNTNYHSNQGHAIFQVNINVPNKLLNDAGIVNFNFTDLAGSERKNWSEEFQKHATKEAIIHKSMLTLKNCLLRLSDGCKPIPFKESKLTRILKKSFNNDCVTVLLFNVSSSSVNFDDTYNTMKYAIRAQKIVNSSERNVLKGDQVALQRYDLKPKSIFTNKPPIRNADSLVKESVSIKKSAVNSEVKRSTIVQNKSAINQVTELTQWYNEIATIYDAIKTAVEGCSTVISKYILLNLKRKCKEEVENSNTLFGSDQSNGMANIRLKPLLEEITKQTCISPNEINYWTNRLQVCKQQVSNLHKKVKVSKFSYFLEPYIVLKECDLNDIKCHHESIHRIKCNAIYVHQTEIYSYLALCAKKLKNQVLQEHYIKLMPVVNSECPSIKEFFEIILPLYKLNLAGSNYVLPEKGCSRIPVKITNQCQGKWYRRG